VAFHPKKPDQAQIKAVKTFFSWANVIDIQYWKSGAKIREMMPDLWKTKNKVLTHHNPYNLHEEKWDDYKSIVVLNKTQHKELPQAHWIPHCIDMNFFKFNENYTNNKLINMTVARIQGKKGIYPVAQACHDLGYKLLVVGRIADPNYWNDVMKKFGKNIEFKENINDKELLDCYYRSSIHVCNSVDFFESGTLPILEAMSCGVPVVTRQIGHVPDIYNGQNLKLLSGQPEDVDGIKNSLKELIDNLDLRKQMRIHAVESIKDRNQERFAADYVNVYKSIA